MVYAAVLRPLALADSALSDWPGNGRASPTEEPEPLAEAPSQFAGFSGESAPGQPAAAWQCSCTGPGSLLTEFKYCDCSNCYAIHIDPATPGSQRPVTQAAALRVMLGHAGAAPGGCLAAATQAAARRSC
jgi:hypothetical protein